jgi:hypothetical protein
MVKKEYYSTRADGLKLYKTYSTDNFKIRQVETGHVYDSAIDVENAPYTYEETDERAETAKEWVDKEKFVNAVYALVPAEAIPAALSDPETAKAAIAGMALLTTDAAPGNQIDIADPRVAAWLSVSGVTVEQVKEVMIAQEN